jgi:hypothetical protein
MATSGKPTVVKLRELLRKIRLLPLTGGAERLAEKTLPTPPGHGGDTAPPNWVPSQQDEGRPYH